MDKQEALKKAAGLCSASERCSAEIYGKLSSWGINKDDAEAIVKRLVNERFIDDNRYARAFVHDRVRYYHWGRRKVLQALLFKGVKEEAAKEAISTLDSDFSEEYAEALRATIESKIKQLGNKEDAQEYKFFVKVMRHAASRGFTVEEVTEALQQYRQE